ncbi:MAG TPA: DNA-processing protein DprA [Baekduia sp.]|nr:DNA-processing protein DprA [Baekduia sp.]
MTATAPAAAGACDACLRRSLLVAVVAGGIEVARRQRRPLRDVLALDEDDLLAAVGGRKADELRERLDRSSLVELRRAVELAELDAVCRHDPGYPSQLLDDRSAPAVLYVRAVGGAARDRLEAAVGAAHREPPPAVAIVGTRKASDDGLAVARALARGLGAAGITVVSGMALGVDSAAHEGALDAGGTTVAVLAGGADVPYPRSKQRLWGRIATTGLVVSEMPPGRRPFPWNFLARNRVIAGLAAATIVVEAAERSGSLVTAELAVELGRDVGAVPGSVLDWRSRGTNALLRDGASVVRDARDALDLVLGVDGAMVALERATGAATRPPADLEPRLAWLLRALDDGRDTVTAIAADPAQAGDVRAGLMELELLGLVERVAGGRVRRVSPVLGEVAVRAEARA